MQTSHNSAQHIQTAEIIPELVMFPILVLSMSKLQSNAQMELLQCHKGNPIANPTIEQ